MRSVPVQLALAALVAGFAAGASAARPAPVEVRPFADTGISLADVLWTGRQFLYVENTANTIWAAGLTGTSPQKFASMPSMTEETRCRLSPGKHGFAAADLYCHAPDNTIYRVSADGSSVSVFAHLPETATSDGALAFDTVGRFGYALLAATGRSGAETPAGGTLYAIDPNGQVRTIASYSAAGGADEVVVAPAGFGTAGGSAFLTIDAGSTGDLLAIDAHGNVRTIARLPDGPNPIVVVTRSAVAPGTPPPGLYLTDTASHKVFFAPASQFAGYVGDLIVGTELKAQLWFVRPHGNGFQTRLLPTTLPTTGYNLEGATYLPGR